MQGNYVDVAFDNHDSVVLSDGLTGHVEPVEHTTFVKQQGLGRIQIFGLHVTHGPPTKGDDVPFDVADGEDDPASEAVIIATVIALDGQPRRHDFVGLVFLFGGEVIEQQRAFFGAVAKLEALLSPVVDLAFGHIGPGFFAAG